MDEPNQALNLPELFTKSILALSWNIATEPKLYRELAPNPYSPRALQIISERFPNTNTVDIIRAVILAEPEGKYDRNFRQLGILQQTEELRKQIYISSEINKRLVQYCNKYATEFSRLPKDFVYDSLSLVVFETADIKKIEQRYAQNQRRDFRLSIVDFIEDTQTLTSCHQQKNNGSSSAIGVSDEKPARGRQLLKIVFAALSLILLFYFAQGVIQSTTQYPQVQEQILGIAAQRKSQRFPVRLIIPVIKVNASIQQVGVTPKGEMEVPNNAADVGWFKSGSRPGEKGSAVISGHFNGENGEAGVFTNLYKLKDGDKLYIEDDKGTSIAFIVRESRIYDPGYAEEVFSSSDSAHLNLITCDGVWDGAKKSFSKRLVVFADIMQ